jgi:predicted metal-dependent peptidase
VHGEQDGHGNGIGVEGWDCGSAADGIARDYEVEGDKVDTGVDGDRADLIRQQVAVEITNHVRNRGNVPGGYARWAKELLEPTVDWRKELASLVRRTFAQVAGLRDYTYKRPSRRQSAMRQTGQNIILPAMRQPNPPKVSIVIDTSGSMSDEMLTWALSETQGVLRSLGSAGRSIRVITCDVGAEGKRITKASDVKLKGGGGTDMRVGINEAMSQRDKPDVVMVLTDGFTPWPSEPLKGATLIVGLTDEAAAQNVPAWARKVVITH